jgi:DUF4097 and DUF4098 domain-containing protein YvlB
MVLLVVAGGCSAGAFKARESFSLTAPWEGYRHVAVQTRNGSVELRCGDAEVVSVSGEKRVRGMTQAEADENLQEIEVLVDRDPGETGTLLVEVRYPPRLRYRSPGASLVIEVPEPCSVDISTGNGRITVKGMERDVKLNTSNGRITARDIDGPLHARTSNGRIEVHGIRGACDLETSNGAITAEDVRGDLDADTSNGRITVVVSPGEGGEVDLESSNGAIEVTLPAGFGADLRLSTSNGRVHTSLGDATLQHLSAGKSSLKAVMNGGGGRVEARTSNGSITVRCR